MNKRKFYNRKWKSQNPNINSYFGIRQNPKDSKTMTVHITDDYSSRAASIGNTEMKSLLDNLNEGSSLIDVKSNNGGSLHFKSIDGHYLVIVIDDKIPFHKEALLSMDKVNKIKRFLEFNVKDLKNE